MPWLANFGILDGWGSSGPECLSSLDFLQQLLVVNVTQIGFLNGLSLLKFDASQEFRRALLGNVCLYRVELREQFPSGFQIEPIQEDRHAFGMERKPKHLSEDIIAEACKANPNLFRGLEFLLVGGGLFACPRALGLWSHPRLLITNFPTPAADGARLGCRLDDSLSRT